MTKKVRKWLRSARMSDPWQKVRQFMQGYGNTFEA